MERNKEYTWEGQLAVGKTGEDFVRQWLQERGLSTTDVRQVASYQKDDIDFLVQDRNVPHEEQDVFTAEVKTDTYDNQYVFFETHTAEKMPGALFKSRARVWYIYKSALGKIIEVQPARVAAHIWINDRTPGAPQFRVYPVFNDKKRIRAWGVKLPISVLEQLGGMVYLLPKESHETDSQDSSTTERGRE